MTGAIELKNHENLGSVASAYTTDTTGELLLSSGNADYRYSGATFALCGRNHPYNGRFMVTARNSDEGSISLEGSPDGTLKWDGKNIVRSINGNSADANGNITPEQTGCLPLSGGTMGAPIASHSSIFLHGSDNSVRRHISSGVDWYKGAYIALDGCEIDENFGDNVKGQFIIGAHNGTVAATLVGRPDGTLIWNGIEVERVNSSGDGWIRYESGIQIVWGTGTYSANAAYGTFSFPVAFARNYFVSIQSASNQAMAAVWAASELSLSSLKLSPYHAGNHTTYLTYNAIVDVICIGYWK